MSNWTHCNGIIIATDTLKRESEDWDVIFGKPVSKYFDGKEEFPEDFDKKRFKDGVLDFYIPYGSEGGINVIIHKMTYKNWQELIKDSDEYLDLPKKPKGAFIFIISGDLRDYIDDQELIFWFDCVCAMMKTWYYDFHVENYAGIWDFKNKPHMRHQSRTKNEQNTKIW